MSGAEFLQGEQERFKRSVHAVVLCGFSPHGKLGSGFDTELIRRQAFAMHPVQFEQSVISILKRDQRYDPHAFFFLKDALDFTLKRVAEGNGGQTRHVSGPELLAGFRDLALEQFGPMATTLMREWGIQQCQDVGDMVFLLIEEQVFGKQDSDKPEDFSGEFDFHESLTTPFLPTRAWTREPVPRPAGPTRSKQPKAS